MLLVFLFVFSAKSVRYSSSKIQSLQEERIILLSIHNYMRFYPIFKYSYFSVHISNFDRKICTKNFIKYLSILLATKLLHLNFSELSLITQNDYLLKCLVCECKKNTWKKTFCRKIYMVTIGNQAMFSVDWAFIIRILWGII